MTEAVGVVRLVSVGARGGHLDFGSPGAQGTSLVALTLKMFLNLNLDLLIKKISDALALRGSTLVLRRLQSLGKDGRGVLW